MPDDFVRSGALQILAFFFAVLGVDLVVFLGTTASHGLGQLLAGGFVVGLYMFAFFMPFFLIDLFVVRPVMAGRVPLRVMILVELVVLLATQVLLRWRGIEAASGSELGAIFRRILRDSGLFLGIYAVCTVIIKRLSSPHASAAKRVSPEASLHKVGSGSRNQRWRAESGALDSPHASSQEVRGPIRTDPTAAVPGSGIADPDPAGEERVAFLPHGGVA